MLLIIISGFSLYEVVSHSCRCLVGLCLQQVAKTAIYKSVDLWRSCWGTYNTSRIMENLLLAEDWVHRAHRLIMRSQYQPNTKLSRNTWIFRRNCHFLARTSVQPKSVNPRGALFLHRHFQKHPSLGQLSVVSACRWDAPKASETNSKLVFADQLDYFYLI